MKELLSLYKEKRTEIQQRLKDFKQLPEQNHIYELFFCLLTPQSNAKKCWQAIEEIKKLKNLENKKIKEILKTKTRFHNNKTNSILKAKENWQLIKSNLNNKSIPELRNWLAENVHGFGLKEASHFLRNIGKSNNEVAILDRHILKNLKNLNIINEDKIKNKSDYLKKEQFFLQFSKKIRIPIDELDLLFWSKENGEIFK